MTELQNELRRKGRIEIGDKLMVYGGEWRLLQIGDTYLAHTEGQEPDILTVRRIEVQKRRTTETVGKIYPRERKKKLYNIEEVVKITFIDNPNLDKENKPDERIVIESDGRVDVHVPGPERLQPGKPEPTRRGKPGPNGPQPRPSRPVPGPPASRPNQKTNYAAASGSGTGTGPGAS